MSHVHAVILAGGSGTRFWPASRRHTPKQLLPLAGRPDEPLIAATVRRIEPIVPADRVWISTGTTLVDATLAARGCVLLTADHGNAEEMAFPSGEPNTQHSTNPVPVVFIAKDAGRFTLRDGGLVDVAPTLLGLLGLPVPARMTGRSLLDPLVGA